MIANTFRNKNPLDATLSPLGNSHNSRWRPRGLSSVKTLKYKTCIVQNSNFSDQILSINVTDVSFCEKVVLSLVFCKCKTKMASKMAAKIKKKMNFVPNFTCFHVVFFNKL